MTQPVTSHSLHAGLSQRLESLRQVLKEFATFARVKRAERHPGVVVISSTPNKWEELPLSAMPIQKRARDRYHELTMLLGVTIPDDIAVVRQEVLTKLTKIRRLVNQEATGSDSTDAELGKA